MCIVIGKYFPKYGWVAVKNRDRNYIPEISFKKKIVDDLEILYFWDDITQYCEGLNSNGIGVLSASLMVLDDEKEIETRAKRPSKDGMKIQKALKIADIKDVAKSLIKQKLTGHTLIFNEETMYVLEGAWKPGKYKAGEYEYVIKEIPKDQHIVRTNHGVWISRAGYQRSDNDESQTLSRISSESRKIIGEYVTSNAKDPRDIIDGLTKDFTHNDQLNALRTTTEKKKMRTTSQILIIPKEKTMYVRPVQSHMSFNFWKFNTSKQQLWVEILSNRVLYTNLLDQNGEPPFDTSLHHISI